MSEWLKEREKSRHGIQNRWHEQKINIIKTYYSRAPSASRSVEAIARDLRGVQRGTNAKCVGVAAQKKNLRQYKQKDEEDSEIAQILLSWRGQHNTQMESHSVSHAPYLYSCSSKVKHHVEQDTGIISSCQAPSRRGTG